MFLESLLKTLCRGYILKSKNRKLKTGQTVPNCEGNLKVSIAWKASCLITTLSNQGKLKC
jgi:hypothetical protein